MIARGKGKGDREAAWRREREAGYYEVPDGASYARQTSTSVIIR